MHLGYIKMLKSIVGIVLLSTAATLILDFMKMPPRIRSTHFAGYVLLWVPPSLPLYWGLVCTGVHSTRSLVAAYALPVCGAAWSYFRGS